ncbi:hypothetical protein EVAR_10564_1 [Eumeta japonica]|uniref:CCHC-type domain-containing protein n=1 Tax=Eumeta variegata TaxID=151549 RepID=A0A4C1U1R2_EUMVA|nr:hypothetical protein EVAR_10564_1 [Eumeta japonica]
MVEVIKIRKVFRGTQTTPVTLAAAKTQKVVGENGRIRIDWCKSEIDRYKLCIKCRDEGHTFAKCNKSARCALRAELGVTDNVAHHTGTSRCPVFKKGASEDNEYTKVRILYLNINHYEAVHECVRDTRIMEESRTSLNAECSKSRHGSLRAYLHRFKHDDCPSSPECPSCPGVAEDAEHVFFVCSPFNPQRDELKKS